MLQNIVIGLVSGLFVSFIVLVIGRFWRGIVEPWFEERVYKDLHIEGRWYSLYVESADYRQESINIQRQGHAICGKMICKCGPDDGEEYTISGSFRNLLLPLAYESADPQKSDRGTITLMSTNNGQRFVGKVAMYETQRDQIETARVVWFRDREDLKKTICYIQAHRQAMEDMREKEEAIREEFSDFFEELKKEFTKEKQQEKEITIEGEANQIEDKS